MKIGLTYDLRNDYLAEGFGEEETAEFDRPDTIAAIEEALGQIGHQTERIGHARRLVEKLGAGRRWELVFNICEGLYGFGREALVPALLEAYRIPYTFSDPLVLALTLHKPMTKRVVRDLGILTPDFAVVDNEAGISRVDLPFPLFAKPVAEGTGKGVDAASKITNRQQLRRVCLRLLQRYQQPVLVETYLPGREFTVAIVGTGPAAEAVGVIEVVLRPGAEASAYSYVNKEKCEELVLYQLADDQAAEQCRLLALSAWRGLGCRDAGRLDIRLDASGRAHFLEVNPLAGLHPLHSDLPIICSKVGISYRQLIDRIVKSAVSRVKQP